MIAKKRKLDNCKNHRLYGILLTQPEQLLTRIQYQDLQIKLQLH